MSLVVAGWRGVCRVCRFCQLVFVGACWRLGFLFVLLVWCLVCSARFGGARGALPHSSHSLRSSPFVISLVVWDGMRLRYGVVLFLVSFLVPCWRLVCRVGVGVSSLRLVSAFRAVGSMSASRVDGRLVSVLFCRAVFVSSVSRVVSSSLCRCGCSFRVRSVGRVGWRRVRSRLGVASWRCGGVAVWRCGVAWRRVCRCAWRGGVAVWRCGDVVSCGAWCGVSGMGGGANGETRGGTMIAPFLSARFGRSRIVLSSVGFSVSSRPSPPWNNITRKMGAE